MNDFLEGNRSKLFMENMAFIINNPDNMDELMRINLDDVLNDNDIAAA